MSDVAFTMTAIPGVKAKGGGRKRETDSVFECDYGVLVFIDAVEEASDVPVGDRHFPESLRQYESASSKIGSSKVPKAALSAFGAAERCMHACIA